MQGMQFEIWRRFKERCLEYLLHSQKSLSYIKFKETVGGQSLSFTLDPIKKQSLQMNINQCLLKTCSQNNVHDFLFHKDIKSQTLDSIIVHTFCPTLRLDVMSLLVDCELQASEHKHAHVLLQFHTTHTFYGHSPEIHCCTILSDVMSKLILKLDRV